MNELLMLLVELISFVMTRMMLMLNLWLRLMLRLSLWLWQVMTLWQSYDRLCNTLTFRLSDLMSRLMFVFNAERNTNSTVAVISIRIWVDDGPKGSCLLRRTWSNHNWLFMERSTFVGIFFALIRQWLQGRYWRIQNDTVLVVLVILHVEYLHFFLLLLGGSNRLIFVRGRFVAFLDDDLNDRLRGFQVDWLMVMWPRWLVVTDGIGDVTLETCGKDMRRIKRIVFGILQERFHLDRVGRRFTVVLVGRWRTMVDIVVRVVVGWPGVLVGIRDATIRSIRNRLVVVVTVVPQLQVSLSASV